MKFPFWPVFSATLMPRRDEKQSSHSTEIQKEKMKREA